MSLERFCRKPVVTVEPTNTVLEAVHKMREHHVGSVVVTSKGAPVGMLTDRDIVLRLVLEEKDPRATPVKDVMSTSVVYVRADDQIDQAVHRIRESGVRRMPILGPSGQVAGMVTLDDLVVLFSAELGEATAAVRSNRGP